MAPMKGRKPVAGSDDSLALERANVKPGDVSICQDPPYDLTDEAQIYWDAAVPELVRAGMFQDSDRYALAAMCEYHSQELAYTQAWHDACTADPDDGGGILGARAREARLGQKQARELLIRMGQEFGLTPVARLRLGLGQIKAATLMDALNQLPDHQS